MKKMEQFRKIRASKDAGRNHNLYREQIHFHRRSKMEIRRNGSIAKSARIQEITKEVRRQALCQNVTGRILEKCGSRNSFSLTKNKLKRITKNAP